MILNVIAPRIACTDVEKAVLMAVVDNELDPAIVDAIAYILGLETSLNNLNN